MTPQERYNLIISFARVLYVNGQATEQTVSAAERLGRSLGVRCTVMPRWGQLQLLEESDALLIAEVPADPTGGGMDRVVPSMRAIQEGEAGRLSSESAAQARPAVPHA